MTFEIPRAFGFIFLFENLFNSVIESWEINESTHWDTVVFGFTNRDLSVSDRRITLISRIVEKNLNSSKKARQSPVFQ